MQLESAGSAKRGLEDDPADINALVIASCFSRLAPATVGREAAICCWRERLVERSQKVHGEAKAEDDLADSKTDKNTLI
mgnify:CR=1 FL=1